MRTFRLVLEYDGSRFAGWQIQPDVRTVQGTVEEAMTRILGKPVRTVAAGRTDAGVHAAGQVVGFSCDTLLTPERLLRGLNGVFPRDVSAVTIGEVHPGFNARYDAASRTYRYTITDRRISIGRKYAWHVRYALSEDLLEESTRSLTGECDLRGFSKGDDNDDYSTVILKKSWTFRDNFMIFEICAVRFFHHAVRSIVGTAVDIARGKEETGLIERILGTRDRSLAGKTAPACGLCLVNVDYGDE